MDESHLKDKDQRPKRRIDKDNPYRLFTVGIVSDELHEVGESACCPG